MDINMADVTLHIDEELSAEDRAKLEDAFRQRDGVISVHNSQERPHLWVLGYEPHKVHGLDLLTIVRYRGLKGELVGF